jgi:hypothetical protein
MRVASVLIGVLLVSSSGSAQDQMSPGTGSGGTEAVAVALPIGGRDPFSPLIAPQHVDRKPAPPVHRPGLAGLTIADAIVTAILGTKAGRMAVLEGPTRRSYVVHLQDRLSDGEVRRIDTNGVVFAVDVASPRTSEVYKGLRSASEKR